jgi:hypothetical protein
LSRELTALEDQFGRWRRAEINVHQLNDQIHAFHQGPSRRLFVIYTGSAKEMMVASAIARGILSEEEATPEIVALLSRSIEYAREDSRSRSNGDDAEGGSASGGPIAETKRCAPTKRPMVANRCGDAPAGPAPTAGSADSVRTA